MLDVELCILGAGSSGIGVAKAAIESGFSSVAIIDQLRPMEATSNNTLRIIHGGFRYLQSANLSRTIDSLLAQEQLLTSYPEFIKELPCLMPLALFGLKSRLPVSLAAEFFSGLQNYYNSKVTRPKVISCNQAAERFSISAPNSALLWYDCLLTDPLLFRDKLVAEIVAAGVKVIDKENIVLVEADKSTRSFIVTTKHHVIRAKKVVNTIGPNVFSLKNYLITHRPKINWCLGFNLVFDKPAQFAALAATSRTGRLLFQVPRDNKISIGTWYCDSTSLEVSEQQIDSALKDIEQAFPALSINRASLVGVDSGFLPSEANARNGDPVPISREIILQNSQYIEVLASKYTTFLRQGQRVLKLLR